MAKSAVYESVETNRERLIDLATELWENPELSLEEYEAATRLQGVLEEEGFEVESGVAGMDTAFVARYGDGDPVIGTMGEFDALPDLSQRRSAEREPVEEGAPGHGCGHNLFGVASLGGAIAIKRAIDRGDISGTVVYYGTPAEEIGVGKPYMVEAGAFDDVDAIVSWHPGWY
ncbi:MAG: M20/M25/M40 family metallo-hydrolase, partial [Halobacteriales archaeon]